MATAIQRKELGALMDFLVAHEPHVHYGQVRPMKSENIHTKKQLEAAVLAGMTMDCSESVTLLSKLVGLRDPNGNHYDGSGYTGTLLANLPHYSNPENAMVGALVVFGPGHGDHVCMVRHAGKDPVLFSHGQERGPLYIKLSEEKKYQRTPVTFLSVAKL